MGPDTQNVSFLLKSEHLVRTAKYLPYHYLSIIHSLNLYCLFNSNLNRFFRYPSLTSIITIIKGF